MKKLMLVFIVAALVTPELFAAGGGPYNNDYPFPDLDCSGVTVDTWAAGMASCSVDGRKGGYCLSCEIEVETGYGVCVKAYEMASCKCKLGTTSTGKRTCKAEMRCYYISQ